MAESQVYTLEITLTPDEDGEFPSLNEVEAAFSRDCPDEWYEENGDWVITYVKGVTVKSV